VLPDPQRQSSQILICGQPVHAVEARESLPPNSSVDVERSSRSFLQNAHHFRTGDWHVSNHKTTVVTSGKIDGESRVVRYSATRLTSSFSPSRRLEGFTGPRRPQCSPQLQRSIRRSEV
jgi:hypothetical protein